MSKGSNEVGWKFALDETGTDEGYNEGAIQTFLDDPLLSIAKESAQNSIDARNDKTTPVILEFQSFYLKRWDFPDHEEFNRILRELISFWGGTKEDNSAEEFFKLAKKVLNHHKIPCLRISDFNTTGLSGAKRENIPFTGWKKLVKSTGVSDNPSIAGGSFGLGKHSSFACSHLRAVIYNTMDLEGFEAYQGVAHLASCYDYSTGKTTGRRGYYGNKENYSNIKEKLILDNKFIRKEPGTDIYVLGFDNSDEDWKDKIICSIMESFLLALHEGNLIFKLDGMQLDKKSLKEVIKKYRSDEYIDIIDKNLFNYYDILEGNIDSTEKTFSVIEENDVILKIALGAGLHNKISMNRSNGMKIYDRKRSRGVEDCAGILTLKGDKVNAYFRGLENPQHDDWFPERAKNQTNPKEARKKIKIIKENIEELIKEMSSKETPESLDAEGMGKYLPDEFDEDEIKRKKIEDVPWEINTGTRVEKKKNKGKIILKREVGEPGGGKNDGSGGNLSNKGPGNKPGNVKKIINTNSIRAFSNKDKTYKLIFSIPEETVSLNADILIQGESSTEDLLIKEAQLITRSSKKNLKCMGNKIVIGKVPKDKIINIQFKLKDSEKWALEVNLYED